MSESVRLSDGGMVSVRALTRKEVRTISEQAGFYGDAYLEQLLQPMLNSSAPATAAGQVVIHLAGLLRQRANEAIPKMQEEEVLAASTKDYVVGRGPVTREWLDAITEADFQSLRRAVIRQSMGIGDPWQEVKAAVAEAVEQHQMAGVILPAVFAAIDDVLSGRRSRNGFLPGSTASEGAVGSPAP